MNITKGSVVLIRPFTDLPDLVIRVQVVGVREAEGRRCYRYFELNDDEVPRATLPGDRFDDFFDENFIEMLGVYRSETHNTPNVSTGVRNGGSGQNQFASFMVPYPAELKPQGC